MTLPQPSWTLAFFERWQAAVSLGIPLPDGEPATWTCLLCELGAATFFLTDDNSRSPLLDKDMVRALLRRCGRPVGDNEQLPLLLAAPLPAGVVIDAALTGMLRDDSYWVRQRTAILLGRRRVSGALDGLCKQLMDADNDARRGAAEGLGHLGEVAAIRPLCSAFGDDDASVDVAVLEALVRIDAWDQAGALLTVEEPSGDGFRAACAIEALERGKGDLSDLAPFLDPDAPELARAVSRYLCGRAAQAAELVGDLSALMQGLTDIDHSQVAAVALAAAGADGLEELIDLLGSPEWTLRAAAAIGLAHVEPGAHVEGALRAALSDDDSDVQREAALSLTVLRGTSQGLSLPFSTAYQFVNRLVALHAGGRLKGQPAQLLGLEAAGPGLVGTLVAEDGNSEILGIGLMVLALSRGELVGPTLEAIARGGRANLGIELRRSASAAMLLAGRVPAAGGGVHHLLLGSEGSINGSGVPFSAALVPLAGECAALAATDPDWEVRIEAIRVLNTLGEHAAPFAALLAAVATTDRDADCRRTAALGARRGWRSFDAATGLAQVVAPGRTQEDEVRAAGIAALQAVEPSLAMALSMQLFSGSRDRSVMRMAAQVLGAGTTSESSRGAVTAAMAQLASDSWVAREAACDLFAALPSDVLDDDLREEVQEALTAVATDDSDSDVQAAATVAIASLASGR